MKRFFEKLQSVKIRDIASLFLFPPAWICSLFFRLRHPHLWLICESRGEARDNGYWLFKYIREHHPEQEVAYAIDSASADRERGGCSGKVIPYGGFTHWVYYLTAEKKISAPRRTESPTRRPAICWRSMDFGKIPGCFSSMA